jgi:thymidylate synthase ThyX
LWQKSKGDGTFELTPEEVNVKMMWSDKFNAEVIDTFRKVIAQQIPVSENVSFTFMLNNDPISHREQMVRHRIGVHFGDNFGVDIIPDQMKSSWWSQSMRIMDYSKFIESNKFFVPESISDDNSNALDVYMETLRNIEKGYTKLVELGIPMEDARNLLPLATTMDISWTINLAGLLHIIGKRSCWILQYGLWGYVIKSMVGELVEKIHPIFREMILPPCFTDGEFKECTFKHENERRVDLRDKLPVCPLYYTYDMTTPEQKTYSDLIHETDTEKLMNKLVPKYSELWDRDAWTGK